MIKQEPSLNGRPVDIQVWKSDGSDGEFPGLHWEEVKEHPDTGEWIPFRESKWTYGPYDCLASVVDSVKWKKEGGYIRYIVLGETTLVYGPEESPRGVTKH